MSAASIRLMMHGPPGSVALADFGRFLDEFQRLTTVMAKDRQMEGAQWRLTKLAISSALAEAQIDIPGDAPALVNDLVGGVNDLHESPTIPNVIPLPGLRHVAAMSAAAHEHPTTIEVVDGGSKATVDNVVQIHTRQAQRATTASLGGFYGKVELLDLRSGKKFGLRDDFTRRWIPCIAADDDVLLVARDLIGQETRVFVGGDITENAARQPLRILVRTIEPQPWTGGEIDRFVGLQGPAEQPAVEIVRSLRDW